MRIFVTGVTGFAGSHLVDRLLESGDQVFGLVHTSSGHIELPQHPRFTALVGDLKDRSSIEEAIKIAKPDFIYHLAGQASPGKSWLEPAETFAINVGGTANLLQVNQWHGGVRTVVVSSSDMYGRIAPQELPITEETAPTAKHPYGISKWATGQLVKVYWQNFGLPVIEARPFNHIGPRQAVGFVVPDFTSQLAAIKKGLKEPILTVGNLNVERDFTDVRDVVSGYIKLMVHGLGGETYLICSGRGTPIQTILDKLVSIAGIDVQIVKDPAKKRQNEVNRIVGSYEKLHQATGWRPMISLDRSLRDAFEDWLNRLP